MNLGKIANPTLDDVHTRVCEILHHVGAGSLYAIDMKAELALAIAVLVEEIYLLRSERGQPSQRQGEAEAMLTKLVPWAAALAAHCMTFVEFYRARGTGGLPWVTQQVMLDVEHTREVIAQYKADHP